MTSPAKRLRLSSQRRSFSSSNLNPNTALRSSINSTSRAQIPGSTTYDIITGENIENAGLSRLSQSQNQPQHPLSQSLRKSTSRQSLLPQPQHPAPVVSYQKHQDDLHVLQARINKLEYENHNLGSERDMLTLQHEKELKDVEARADADYRRYQDAETERLKVIRQNEELAKEIKQIRDQGVNTTVAAERKSRDLQTQNNLLREEKEDLQAKLNDADREMKRMLMEEVEGKRSQLERHLRETAEELDEMKSRLDNVSFRLQQKEKESETLENRVLELSGRAAGGEELELVRRELSEQVAYVRRLENQTREQGSEIRKLHTERKSVNLVVEEKRALQVRIAVLEEAERRANELEIQKEILEDEKRIWTSFLEREGGEGQREFETPEAVVKALINERFEHALLLERIGATETELQGKEEALRAVESERNVLKMELEKAKAAQQAPLEDGPVDVHAFRRVDIQRQLAQKEVEFLKSQLEGFQAEETMRIEQKRAENSNLLELELENGQASSEPHTDALDDHDNPSSTSTMRPKLQALQDTVRSQELELTRKDEQKQYLESVLQEHKIELERMQTEMLNLQSALNAAQTSAPKIGQKRGAETQDAEDNQDGHLLRKNKNLQVALQKVTSQSQILATELQAVKSQLKALRASTSVRVLELRDNPTSQHEVIKASTLRTLKQENAELMTQLRGNDPAMSQVKVIPVSSYDALKLDLNAMESVIADKEKRMRRQREIWTQKAAEFRDVISSILGYRVTFLPNGKVKIRSMYYQAAGGNPEDEDDREDYIEFDGDKGTMKIGGGTNSPFGQEISETVNFWVKEKKEIPVFLAAMTIEFYEKFGGMQAVQENN